MEPKNMCVILWHNSVYFSLKGTRCKTEQTSWVRGRDVWCIVFLKKNMLKWHLIRCNQNRIVSPVFLMKSIASEKIMVVFGSKPIYFILSFGSTWTPHRHFWGTLGYKKTHPINNKGIFFWDKQTTNFFFEKKTGPLPLFLVGSTKTRAIITATPPTPHYAFHRPAHVSGSSPALAENLHGWPIETNDIQPGTWWWKQLARQKKLYTLVNWHRDGTCTLWRCISYWEKELSDCYVSLPEGKSQVVWIL